MAQQKTDWGEILWLDKEEGPSSAHSLQVGLVSLPPGGHQPKHIHYEEQVIYVAQGQALSWIDGKESKLCPGDYFHWKAGVEHEILNVGGDTFQHLLVSNPMSADLERIFPEDENEVISLDLIYIAVEAVRTQFLDALHYGYAIFDTVGNLIVKSQFFPGYCVESCFSENNEENCICMRYLGPQEWEQEQVFQCRYGMEIFHYPIYFKGTFLGYIQSGYIRHSSTQKGKIENVYDVPESVVTGIKALIQRIVKAIRNYCEFEQFRRNLMEKELRIASHEETQKILMKNLQDTQYAVTDLKINHHFLFNTLNSMASMALDGGMMNLYQSIIDLSKMFHYTLRTQNSIVSLEKEIGYVRAYLQLQKMRYEEALEVDYCIDQKVQNALVPFNFLQPIVENAFIHGFDKNVHKKIKIRISREQKKIGIEVENSGKMLTPQICHTINQGILSNTSHGLSMIYRKLTAVFEDECVFEIGVGKGGNTCFYITIPYKLDRLEMRMS